MSDQRNSPISGLLWDGGRPPTMLDPDWASPLYSFLLSSLELDATGSCFKTAETQKHDPETVIYSIWRGRAATRHWGWERCCPIRSSLPPWRDLGADPACLSTLVQCGSLLSWELFSRIWISRSCGSIRSLPGGSQWISLWPTCGCLKARSCYWAHLARHIRRGKIELLLFQKTSPLNVKNHKNDVQIKKKCKINKKANTYNRQDLLVVTHPTTNRPARGLYMDNTWVAAACISTHN